MNVRVYAHAEDALLECAVILARCHGDLVLCRHRDRATWEFPGGHREPGETIVEAAARELQEETGAQEFELHEICPYSVEEGGVDHFYMLFYAEIHDFNPELHHEIREIRRTRTLPDKWTYPEIQQVLLSEVARRGLIQADFGAPLGDFSTDPRRNR